MFVGDAGDVAAVAGEADILSEFIGAALCDYAVELARKNPGKWVLAAPEGGLVVRDRPRDFQLDMSENAAIVPDVVPDFEGQDFFQHIAKFGVALVSAAIAEMGGENAGQI